MERSADGKGKCSSCGFLAKFDARYDGPPPYIYETPYLDRDSGELSAVHIEGRQIITFIHCFINELDLWEFIDAGRAQGQHIPMVTKNVLQEDRQCQKWHQYTPGFSPQEHLDEVRMLELELKRQEFEQRMAREHQELMERLDSGNKRVQLILGFVLGGIAVLEILVGLMQVLYPTGWPWLQHLLGITPLPPTPLLPT